MIINFTRKNSLSILSTIFSLFIVLTFSSCARKLTFGVSPVVPAATGSVKIKKVDNGDYHITVKVMNLAPANRLTPARDVYIVWMESNRNAVKNLGIIKSSSGLFSNTLKGNLEATVPVTPTSVFITAEDNEYVRYPGNQLVLKTE